MGMFCLLCPGHFSVPYMACRLHLAIVHQFYVYCIYIEYSVCWLCVNSSVCILWLHLSIAGSTTSLSQIPGMFKWTWWIEAILILKNCNLQSKLLLLYTERYNFASNKDDLLVWPLAVSPSVLQLLGSLGRVLQVNNPHKAGIPCSGRLRMQRPNSVC